MTLHKVSKETVGVIDIVVEELFTNVVKYSDGTAEDIAVTLSLSGNELSISLEDPTSTQFDLTKAPEPNLELSLEDRTPGGLGIFLVKQLTDSVRHEFRDGKSVITVTKQLE